LCIIRPPVAQRLTTDSILLGIGAISVAFGVMMMSIMNTRLGGSGSKIGTRERYLFAASVAVCAMAGLRYYPFLSEAYGYLSFTVLLLLPFAFSILIARELMRADI